MRELRLDPHIRAQHGLIGMRIGGRPVPGRHGSRLGLRRRRGRGCWRLPIRTGDGATPAAPLGKQPLGDKRILRRVILGIVQIRQMVAKLSEQRLVADGGTVFGRQGEYQVG